MRRINSTVFRAGITVNWKNKSKIASYKNTILGTKVINSWLPFIYKDVVVKKRKKLNDHQKWLALRYTLRAGRRRFLSKRGAFSKMQFFKVLSFLGIHGMYNHSFIGRDFARKKDRSLFMRTRRFWVFNLSNVGAKKNKITYHNNKLVHKAIFKNAAFSSPMKVWSNFSKILRKGRQIYSYNRFWNLPFKTFYDKNLSTFKFRKALSSKKFIFNRYRKKVQLTAFIKNRRRNMGLTLAYKVRVKSRRTLIKPVDWSTELRRNSFLITLFNSFLKPRVRMPRTFGKPKLRPFTLIKRRKMLSTKKKVAKFMSRVVKVQKTFFKKAKLKTKEFRRPIPSRLKKRAWRVFTKLNAKLWNFKASSSRGEQTMLTRLIIKRNRLFNIKKKGKILIKTNMFVNQLSKYYSKDVRFQSLFVSRRKPVVSKFFMRKQVMLANQRRMRIFYKFYRRLFHFLDTALYFRSSFLLATCLKQEIEKTKYHYKCLNTLSNLTSIALLSKVNVQGVFIRMRGTLNKTKRTRTWSSMLWSNHIEFTNPKVPTQYTLLHCVTYKGTFGLGVWVL